MFTLYVLSLIAASFLPLPADATATAPAIAAPNEPSDALCRRIEHGRARELGFLALSLDTSTLVRRAGHGRQVIRAFPLEVGRAVDLELTPFSIHGPDGRIPAAGPGGTLHLRGKVLGVEDSKAFLSTSPAGTFGWIIIGTEQFTLSTGPLSGPRVLTSHRRGGTADRAISWSDWNCRAAGPRNDSSPPDPMPHPRHSGPSTPCRSMSIALYGDPTFVALFGGDVAAAKGYMETLVAGTSEIYEANLNIRLMLDHHEVFSDQAPFPIGGDLYTNLIQFGSWWTGQPAAQRPGDDAAHLLLGNVTGAAGIAFTGSTCFPEPFYRTGVEGGLTGHFPYPLETESDQNWDIYVVAHELGHNIGMQHTHDFNPPIDDCADCFTHGPDAASGPGTLMSYCQLCTGGMSNIQLEFHPSNIQLANAYLDAQGCLPECVDCPGDLNGDLQVDSADLGLLIAAWGTADSVADISEDGTVDGADLAYVLGYWGLCSAP